MDRYSYCVRIAERNLKESKVFRTTEIWESNAKIEHAEENLKMEIRPLFRRWGVFLHCWMFVSGTSVKKRNFLWESSFSPIVALINFSDSDPKLGRGEVLACDNASLSVVGPLF